MSCLNHSSMARHLLLSACFAGAILASASCSGSKADGSYTCPDAGRIISQDFLFPAEADTAFFMRYPYRIDIKDSLAVVMDLHNDTYFFYAYTYPGWEPITGFGKRGQGPQELLCAERMRICSTDSVWVIDSVRQLITRWKISFSGRTAECVEEISLDGRLLRSMDFCKTEDGFLVTDYTGQYRYHVLDKDGRIVKSVGRIPVRDEHDLNDLPALAQAWRSFVSYNEHNGTLAMVTQLGEVLEVFNLKTGFHHVAYGPAGEPVFKAAGGEAFPKGIKGFNDVLVTDSCIYAVFDGLPLDEHMKPASPLGGKSVYVFDLHGKPVRRMTLDYSAFGLCYRDNHFFFTSTDTDQPVMMH